MHELSEKLAAETSVKENHTVTTIEAPGIIHEHTLKRNTSFSCDATEESGGTSKQPVFAVPPSPAPASQQEGGVKQSYMDKLIVGNPGILFTQSVIILCRYRIVELKDLKLLY